MNGLDRALTVARRITAVHEETLYSLDEQAPEYDALRAETARRVLHECDLRQIVGEVNTERGIARAAAPAGRTCNHLLYRDGRCVGCGAEQPLGDLRLVYGGIDLTPDIDFSDYQVQR